jgi:hypothetical protein
MLIAHPAPPPERTKAEREHGAVEWRVGHSYDHRGEAGMPRGLIVVGVDGSENSHTSAALGARRGAASSGEGARGACLVDVTNAH